MPTERDLLTLREGALQRHREWKQRSLTSDLIVQNRWRTLWPDLMVEETDPAVENVYAEALEDKAGSGGASAPFVDVAPTRGTQADRAEREAQLRRRAYVSLIGDSDLPGKQPVWIMDWLQHGVMYGMPWSLPDEPEYPFAIRLDPRFVYPLAHNSRGRLSKTLVIRNRTIADVHADYPDNPRVKEVLGKWRLLERPQEQNVEEIWFVDDTTWGVALVLAQSLRVGSFYVAPEIAPNTSAQAEWIIPPHPHRLKRCPVVERAKATGDGEYRGALDLMIPQLKHAHNLTSQLLLQVTRNVFAPIIAEGLENPEQIGPDALLLGDGSGTAKIDYPRPPVNYEALQHVAQQMAAARNLAAFPQQRSGDFGASIASAKGVHSVMGQYNTQLGWAQRDLAAFYTELLGRLANYDQVWCGGTKLVTGFDEGEMFTDKYDPATFWKDDFRVFVGFHGEGLDLQSHSTRMALIRNMGGIGLRTFMRQTGVVDNVLGEERDMALEQVQAAFQAFMFQQAQAGNMDPLRRYAALVDGDKETTRSATLKVIAEMFPPVPAGPAGIPQGGLGDPGAAVMAERSLDAGGIPGNAEGLPPPSVGPGLASLLPAGAARAVGAVEPGGTG